MYIYIYIYIYIYLISIPYLSHHGVYSKFERLISICEGFNPFRATGLFSYSLKTSEKVWFSGLFRRYRKRSVA